MNNYKRVCAYIHLDAFAHNLDQIEEKIADTQAKIVAVIKTDAYGHGALELAACMESRERIWGYAVATVEEAQSLRTHGMKKPILILGYTFSEQYEEMIREDIRLSVFTLAMAKEVSKAASKAGKTAAIHIALDTGMSRIGYQINEESADEIAQIAALPHIMIEGIFTHFSKADETDKYYVRRQFQLFRQMMIWLKQRDISIPLQHVSNSAAIAEIPEVTLDLVRAGIILYGLWPSEAVDKGSINLKPVLELKSHVVHVKTLEAGRMISYGGTYVTEKETIIATIPVGYGDGYARGLSNKGYVLIHGKKAPICGRVCMDQFMVDVTDIPDVKTGDVVTLIGTDGTEHITLEELGALSGRFNYEFACDLGRRIPRVFLDKGNVRSERNWF